jgi:hypothetical protein
VKDRDVLQGLVAVCRGLEQRVTALERRLRDVESRSVPAAPPYMPPPGPAEDLYTGLRGLTAPDDPPWGP